MAIKTFLEDLKKDTAIFQILSLVACTCLLASIYFLINLVSFHYQGILYFNPKLLFFLPAAMILLGLAIYFKKETPFLSFVTKAYTTYYFIYLAISFLASAVQLTPFPPIDPYLVELDKNLGFSTAELMAFVHQHLTIDIVLSIIYNTIRYQLIILPCILILIPSQQKQVLEFFKLMLLTACAGMSLYYFFPTVGPAHFIQSPYFTVREHNTYLKFYEVHHNLQIKSLFGGMIAFPSFHALWAILVTYAYRKLHLIFYPLLLLNILLILATLLLGWHYLMDILGSFLVFLLALTINNKLSQAVDKLNSAS